MNETLQTIARRSSCRLYEDKPLETTTLQTILQAAIEAPSAMNNQLCEAFVVTNIELIDELANAINIAFEKRGEKKPENYHCAYHAPVLVIISGPDHDTRRVEDGSCMLENIFLAATSINIGSCWINQLRDTQNMDPVRPVLSKIGLPQNHLVVGCAALGYAKHINKPKRKNKHRIHYVQ